MRIILARTAGFCMGVKRAMDKALTLAQDRSGPVYTYGPLIHNRQAIELLETRGVCARTDFGGTRQGKVLLRTHGVPPDVVQGLRDAGIDVEDGTCPHVLRGQRSVERRSKAGYRVVVVGDRDHDEVAGLVGHASGPCHVIATTDEAREVPLDGDVLVVAQTTFDEDLFHRIVAELRARKPGVEVVESICNATSERQDEARELAGRVDAMVVVGGFHSANTRRLAEIARHTGTPTFHVETADELDADRLADYDTVGVTAGASTPSWITRAVIDRLQRAAEARSLGARLRGRAVRLVIDGNLYVAAGAAALTYAATRLLGLGFETAWGRAALMTAAFGYIFSVYTLGRRGETQAGRRGATRRAAFYKEHPGWMDGASVLLSVAAVAVLVPFGWAAVVLLGLSYAMAVGYSAALSPRQRSRPSLIRSIPASKDLLVAGGWTVVTVLVPVVAAGGAGGYAVAVVGAFVFGLAFTRSVMFDFADVTSDRLLGRDTLPALVGPARVRAVLSALSVAVGAALAAGASAGVLGGPAWWMLACPAYVLCCLLLFDRWVTASERRCAVATDGVMLLAGAIALVYALAS